MRLLAPITTSLLLCSQAWANEWIIEDSGSHKRPLNIDGVGFLSHRLIGVSGSLAIPLAHDGFLPKVNDSFDLEIGAVLANWYDGVDTLAVVPLGGVRWKFHLTREWTTFAMAKIGVGFALSGRNNSFGHEFGVGAYWHFSKDMSLRLEASSLGLGAGISMNM